MSRKIKPTTELSQNIWQIRERKIFARFMHRSKSIRHELKQATLAHESMLEAIWERIALIGRSGEWSATISALARHGTITPERVSEILEEIHKEYELARRSIDLEISKRLEDIE